MKLVTDLMKTLKHNYELNEQQYAVQMKTFSKACGIKKNAVSAKKDLPFFTF